MKKTLKIFCIIIVTFVITVYGGVFLGHKAFFIEETSAVPTIQAVTDGTFILGVQARLKQPETVEEFIPVLAEQLKRYNEVAPVLWQDNAVVNQSLIIEKIRGNKFWIIDPDGTVTPITKKQALSYGFSRNTYVDGFSFFDGGMYYAIADKDVKNVLDWQKYLHLGTHDAILFLTHEQFHNAEQEKWQYIDNIPNRGRSEFLGNIPARAKRALLQNQLLKAVSEPNNTQLILEALSTYEDWKANFPEDYKNSYYFDRKEGAAYYYELVSGLYIGYPDQIITGSDLDRALALLATRKDIYVRHGLVAEAYTVGGFSCVLLDRLEDDWQKRLMDNPEATPIEMLYQHFKDEELPAPQELTQVEVDTTGEEIQRPTDVKPRLFRFLFDILF